jgi:two-component system sensor histidine kinase MtrB
MTVLVLVLGLAPLVLGGQWLMRAIRRRRRAAGATARALHELRGALSALELGITMVERGNNGARVDGVRSQVERAGAALQALEAVSALAKAGGRPHRREVFELSSLVRQRARCWSQLAPAYGGSVAFAWHAGTVWFEGERTEMVHALDNLIANALEHGGGRVRVEGRVVEGALRVAVCDQGPGLSRRLASVREAGARSRRGHGLAIAREGARRNGGRLVELARSKGAAVALELPLPASGRMARSRRARDRAARREPVVRAA